MDPELEKVIARLEARFDAALAVEEEEAAADLAISLRQDRSLAELLRSGGALRLLDTDGAGSAVTVLGADYCGTGTPLACVRRLGSLPLLVENGGRPPETRRDSLQEVAPGWDRAGRRVLVGLDTAQNVSGRLIQVGPDNVVLEKGTGRLIVPLWSVGSIRLVHEG